MSENLKRYLIDRLKEPSTWQGVILLITLAGVTVTPQWSTLIITAGATIGGVLSILIKEQKIKL